MKILLTGGAGFIGSHLAEKLLEEKHSVVALDDLSTGSDSNISSPKNSPDFSFIEGSILNQELINQLVESVDGVIHLGAALGVKRILDFPYKSFIANTQGTENVILAATKFKKRIFIASTSEIYGKKFVISAGSVNTAALLLRSGVANSSDQVGRNFMMHNNSHIAAVDMRRKNDVTFQKTLSFTDWYLDGGKGYPLGAVQLIGKVQGIMMKSFAKLVPLPLLNLISDHSVEFVVMSEDLPHPENRVTIAENGSIKLSRKAVGMKTHMELLRRAKKILRKAGYQATFRQPFDISMNSHQCGTTVAGNDPRTSVVDGYCRSHDHHNLYLIDGGFFPSSAAMNPALTIAAQALRVVAESDLAKV